MKINLQKKKIQTKASFLFNSPINCALRTARNHKKDPIFLPRSLIWSGNKTAQSLPCFPFPVCQQFSFN